MKHVIQPKGSSLCGQCVVAMLADVELEEVVKVMGTGGNYPRRLIKFAKHFGVELENKSFGGDAWHNAGIPRRAGAAFLTIPEGEGHVRHWAAWDGELFYDPRGYKFLGVAEAWECNLYLVKA